MIRAYRVTISALCLKLCEGLSPRIKQKAGGRYAADLFLQLPARGEQALADKSKPIPLPAAIAPASERDEIRQRVSNFKAHQEKMAREREDYYLQVKARMLASVPTISLPPH